MKTNYRYGEIISLCNQVDYASDQVEFRQVFETSNGGVALLAFKEGQKLETHTSPFQVMVTVCEGEIDFTMLDETHLMKAGDALLMGANVAHSVKARANSKVLLVKIKD
ncbi:MAG: cupin domain-containing protein [Muribaculaceae bacterium]|nr:cupin domain-containing protein [Muribaculaceae bacterium]